MNKRWRGIGASSRKGKAPLYHPYGNYHQVDVKWDGPCPSSTPPPVSRPLMATVPQRLCVLGPCLHCWAFGHLVATYPTKGRLYPFIQAAGSCTEEIAVDLDEVSVHVYSVDKCCCLAKSHTDMQCVNSLPGINVSTHHLQLTHSSK